MSRSELNAVANVIGLVLNSGLTTIFTIIYFWMLGSGNFGLISFCTTILLVGNLFVDLGIGRTVIRELARREHIAEAAQDTRDALFTLQTVHFMLAIACGLIIAASSRWLATQWLHRGTVDVTAAVQAISLLAILAALQLPRELCRAAFAGLQKQVLSNIYAVGFSLLRGLATLAALRWIAPTPTIFLTTQVIVSSVETVLLLFIIWRLMPKSARRPRFSVRIIKETWMFATGDGLAVLLGIGMLMGDRILLSRLLPLDLFGGYSLAIMIAEIILRAAGPFSSAYFPHFTDLITRNDEKQLSAEYHRVTIIVAAVLMPAAFIMIFFSNAILVLVSGHLETAIRFAPVLAIRALGNTIGAMQYFPHTLQLATGLSSVALYLNIVNVSIYLPGIVLLTPAYGVTVPAILWLFIMMLQAPPMVYFTHRRVLKGEAWSWATASLWHPALICLPIVTVSAFLVPRTISWLVTLPWMAATYLLGMISILLWSAQTRPVVIRLWRAVLSKGLTFIGLREERP